MRLEERLGVRPDSRWVTFDNEQSRSLLFDRDVTYVPYVSPRDSRGIIGAHKYTRQILPEYEGAVSTGAGLALSVLPSAALKGLPAIYIESVSRVQGPSMTGLILSHVPRVGLYTQHESWAERRWLVGPSVLSDYTLIRSDRKSPAKLRILVTLGTIRPYRFDRLLDAVRGYALGHDYDVLWQVGCTTRSDLPGKTVAQLSEAEFRREVASRDLVIAHAGVGVSMSILDLGKPPLLMARDPRRGEHVDSHQEQIYSFLVSRGLAFNAAAALQDPELLDQALTSEIRSNGHGAANRVHANAPKR